MERDQTSFLIFPSKSLGFRSKSLTRSSGRSSTKSTDGDAIAGMATRTSYRSRTRPSLILCNNSKIYSVPCILTLNLRQQHTSACFKTTLDSSSPSAIQKESKSLGEIVRFSSGRPFIVSKSIRTRKTGRLTSRFAVDLNANGLSRTI